MHWKANLFFCCVGLQFSGLFSEGNFIASDQHAGNRIYKSPFAHGVLPEFLSLATAAYERLLAALAVLPMNDKNNDLYKLKQVGRLAADCEYAVVRIRAVLLVIC